MEHDAITGVANIDKVVAVDQQPIGRTPRSNPATYSGVFDKIRKLFADTQEAKVRGYQQGRFSFNVKGGRCETCAGDGTIKIEMHFLPDVYVNCEACNGARYNRETLEISYRGKSIADVLNMPVAEALTFFERQPAILRHIQSLSDVGSATCDSVSRRPRSPAARPSASSWRRNWRVARPVTRSTCWTSRRRDYISKT